ncbi:MAG: hypothetical protein ACRCWR_11065 [Saezia sp.]
MEFDLVEFAMAVEDEFNITINDADAAEIGTCRQLANYVISRLDHIDTADPRCLSQVQFHHFRNVLVNEFGAHRKDIKLDSLIRPFLGKNIKKEWAKLKEAAGSKQFPRLYCKGYFYFLTLLAALSISAAFLELHTPASALIPLGLFFFLWILFSAVLYPVFANQIPSSDSIRKLVPFVELKDPTFKWKNHPEHILHRIRVIAADNFGMDIEKVDPDAHFINDLGVD